MRIKITLNGNHVNTIDLKTDKKSSKFDYVRRLEAMQETEDVLKIGRLGHADFGIKSLAERNGITTNKMEGKTSNVEYAGNDNNLCFHSSVMGIDVSNQMKETNNLRIDDADMGVKVCIEMYEPGWVLNTGKISANIFGGQFNAYLRSIGRSNIRSCVKDGAKVFPAKKALIAYLGKYQNEMRFCVDQHGYHWSAETSCDQFAEDYEAEKATMTEKKREKSLLEDKEISDLLNFINSAAIIEEADEVPDEVNDEDMKAEAIGRMKNLNLWQRIIGDFAKTGKIYQSEFGGIIYDMDEDAKKAVEKARNDGNLPYHVVVTNTTFGRLYSVLFVSEEPDEWCFERPKNDGIMMNYTYNATDPDLSEYGDSQFISANGGMQRVA